MTTTANAIRTVTAKVQTAISDGSRSAAIDAHDIVEILLAIADELDPEFVGDAVPTSCECPKCGEYHADALGWIDDARCSCSNCGTVYAPQTDYEMS